MPNMSWVAAAKIEHLAIHPMEPTLQVSARVLKTLGIGGLHPISVSCENINHHLFVLHCPLSVPWVLLNDRLDIVLDVFHLSPFVV